MVNLQQVLSVASRLLVPSTILDDPQLTSAGFSPQYAGALTLSLEVLQQEFYNASTGLYQGYNPSCDCYASFWWNSANCITTLADLTTVDRSYMGRTYPIFNNTFTRAQASSLMQQKFQTDDLGEHCVWPWSWTCPKGQPSPIVPEGFINDFWDDAGWWGLAWIGVYDLSGNKSYLEAAVDIWQHMAFEGYNATCGGMWWNKAKQQQNAITNEIFLSLAAHLASRVDNGDYYTKWALKQWLWFESSGLIQPSGLVVDRLDDNTCRPIATGPSFSYNQGVILGALIELDRISPNSSYVKVANKIADAAIASLTNNNGILTEYGTNGRPNLGFDGPTFKGVFIRNLAKLQQANGNGNFSVYIMQNALSVWRDDRSLENGTLGNVWDHYYEQRLPQGHCAGMDALVAGAAMY